MNANVITVLQAAAKALPAKGKVRPQVEQLLQQLEAVQARKTDFAARGRLAWETRKAKLAEETRAKASRGKAPKATKLAKVAKVAKRGRGWSAETGIVLNG